MNNQSLVGRPQKYDSLYAALDNNALYSPALIANFAEESGYILSRDLKVIKMEKQRIRIATARLFNYHLPEVSDGLVQLNGSIYCGWYGRTIKNKLGVRMEDEDGTIELGMGDES